MGCLLEGFSSEISIFQLIFQFCNLNTATSFHVVSHLSPQEAAKAKEDTPQPLFNGQTHAAEWFSTKLYNEDLHEEREAKLGVFDHFAQ